MKHKIIFLSFFLFVSLSCLAQRTADDILKKAEKVYLSEGAVKADFIAKTISQRGGNAETMKGTVLMDGSKFYLDGSDLKVWYDGNNQWVLLANSDEVNLTKPTEDELSAINPASFFKYYKKGFRSKVKGSTVLNGSACDEVVLTPLNSKGGISKLTIFIDQKTGRIRSLQVENTNGVTSQISIMNYQTKQMFSDSQFKFDTSKYPDIEVIDLR